jgi:hypothetical protein
MFSKWVGEHNVLVRHLVAGQLLPRDLSHAVVEQTAYEASSNKQRD